jgi:CBS domain containing-hemolysin-like protein
VSGPTTPQDVDLLVARHGFSRFPVTGTASGGPGGPGGQDGAGGTDLVGYLHVKDLLYADDERYTRPVPEKRVRTLASVRVDDEAEDVLDTMQRSASHLARVVDDEGRTVGVVFLEDVLEELVGEVRDATQRRSRV